MCLGDLSPSFVAILKRPQGKEKTMNRATQNCAATYHANRNPMAANEVDPRKTNSGTGTSMTPNFAGIASGTD